MKIITSFQVVCIMLLGFIMYILFSKMEIHLGQMSFPIPLVSEMLSMFAFFLMVFSFYVFQFKRESSSHWLTVFTIVFAFLACAIGLKYSHNILCTGFWGWFLSGLISMVFVAVSLLISMTMKITS